MGTERDLCNFVVQDVCTCPNGEELFGRLYPVAGHDFLVAVADARVAVIELQVLDHELLPDVNHLVHTLARQTDQLHRKLVRTHPQDLTLLVELHSRNRTPVVVDLHVHLSPLQHLNLQDAKVAVFGNGEVAVSRVQGREGLSTLAAGRLFPALEVDVRVGFDVLVGPEGIERVRPFAPSQEVVTDHVALVELELPQLVPPDVAVLLGLLAFLKPVQNLRYDFDLLVSGQLGIEVEGLEGLLEQGQHDQV